MYAVGRLGSYISQGVYTVSGPFHPFGGAVDIVVVQQQDGSLKSSPWYVRFGKFQGVLKARVRVVDINVNGVDADFHMHLDPRGEAYFLREVDVEESVSSHSSTSVNYDGAFMSRTSSKRSRLLGFVLGKRSVNEQVLPKEENESNIGRKTSLESAEIAADLLEMRWSTNLSPKTISNNKIGRESRNDNGEITGGRLEASLVLHEQHFVNKLENTDHEDNLENEVDDTNDTNGGFQVSEQYVEEQLIFGDLDDSNPSINKEQEVKQAGSESTSVMYCPDDLEGLNGNIRRCPSNLDISRSCEVEAEVGRQAKSLPNMWGQFNDPIEEDMDEDPQIDCAVDKLKSSNWDLLREADVSRIKEANLENESPQNANNFSNDLKDGSVASGGPPDIGGSGRWRLWPFRRLGSKNLSENTKTDSDVDAVAETKVDTVAEAKVDAVAKTNVEKEWSPPKCNKMHVRSLIPTPEQLASLNLSEGQNTVTFTFSTSVLGTQKVDARIYLWRWDSRIVISDVDGTITKSDVLGQFMPLVGRDWSHIGVTHLFSAIKENGYQMLYLSARAVSQASITRQFLFNLKQDGKTLPDGPVVISPDGLFPSLFREVIRRVPHEFKIACLEDIRVCFPPDRNPFYAGFGNRHTDEFSYLKVGIPKGKIFIINPKGEVVINRCIDSRSYASIHALVNGIFPPISLHEEQEDYNSWNFWKLPPPTIE
ncbi:phosphatidate phosphatase PAH2-like isoform X1 [Bidens hawaiensis]|uniref:phosphatidate phosphatase PAH2-like isoform X1 n=1 Tax=Bidens hawaiensis TaxID=980011 RepID=UPI00404B15B2